MDIEQQLGIKLSVLLSGLIGGIVSLTYEEKISTSRAILLIIGGASTAAYLQPLAEHYLSIPENLSAGLGFVLGLVSMKVIDFILINTERFLETTLTKQDANSEPDTERSGHVERPTRTPARTPKKKTKKPTQED